MTELPRCFHCFKEHPENDKDDFDSVMFCSKKCADEWHEMTKDWKF